MVEIETGKKKKEGFVNFQSLIKGCRTIIMFKGGKKDYRAVSRIHQEVSTGGRPP